MKSINRIKINPINFAIVSFVILLATAITPALFLSTSIFNNNLYYMITAFLILIAVNILVAFIRVSDLEIPNQLKLMYFFGLFYNLPRENFKFKLSKLVEKYGKSMEEKKSISSFLFYSTIHFYFLLFAYFITFLLIIILILYVISRQQLFFIPFSLLILLVFSYGCYVIFNSTFSKSMFANLSFTFKSIKNHQTLLLNSNTKEFPKAIKEEILDYSYLFTDNYKAHIPLFDKMLNELSFANDIEWFGTKYFARLYYDEMIGFGIMKKTTAEKASKCFSMRFLGIEHGTFKGKEQNNEISEKIKCEVKLIIGRLNK